MTGQIFSFIIVYVILSDCTHFRSESHDVSVGVAAVSSDVESQDGAEKSAKSPHRSPAKKTNTR